MATLNLASAVYSSRFLPVAVREHACGHVTEPLSLLRPHIRDYMFYLVWFSFLFISSAAIVPSLMHYRLHSCMRHTHSALAIFGDYAVSRATDMLIWLVLLQSNNQAFPHLYRSNVAFFSLVVFWYAVHAQRIPIADDVVTESKKNLQREQKKDVKNGEKTRDSGMAGREWAIGEWMRPLNWQCTQFILIFSAILGHEYVLSYWIWIDVWSMRPIAHILLINTAYQILISSFPLSLSGFAHTRYRNRFKQNGITPVCVRLGTISTNEKLRHVTFAWSHSHKNVIWFGFASAIWPSARSKNNVNVHMLVIIFSFYFVFDFHHICLINHSLLISRPARVE